jgi:hypothetical protein
LVVVVVGDGLRVGGIEFGRLIEVVRGKSLEDLVVLWLLTAHVELGLGWAPGGMNQRRRGGLADVGEDSGDGLGLGEERDEGEGCLADGADQGKHLIDPCQ